MNLKLLRKTVSAMLALCLFAGGLAAQDKGFVLDEDFEGGIQKAWELGVRRYVTEFWYTGNPEWEKDMYSAVTKMKVILDELA